MFDSDKHELEITNCQAKYKPCIFRHLCKNIEGTPSIYFIP